MTDPFAKLSLAAKSIRSFANDLANKKGIPFLDALTLLRAEHPEEGGLVDEVESAWKEALTAQQFLPDAPILVDRSCVGKWYVDPGSDGLYWPRVRQYLLEKKGWNEHTVTSIDRTSAKILSWMHNPKGPDFNTRGLVLGYVQSGKTANFLALISKAADAGYKFVIVLSGLTNSLRKQTQERFDADLIEACEEEWITWTTAENDFSRNSVNVKALLKVDLRHLVITKKNETRLRELIAMINDAEVAFSKTSILIVDDECDQASVNASGDVDDPTTINKLLRQLINLPRVAYVGYTATPFANVLTDPDLKDIYPKDFIAALPRPEGYFGAEKLFGRDALLGESLQEDTGLDMIRRVKDHELEDLRPTKREDREDFFLSITPSLRDAIWYYWMATAAREVRGQAGKHSSMLIHTTFYAAPHLNAQKVVEQYRSMMLARVRQGDSDLMAAMEKLWTDEQGRIDRTLLPLDPVPFEAIKPLLESVIEATVVAVENSDSDERLDYSDKEGKVRRYIAIGGNVLARGLTLEGLVVSYFARKSSQYDSLMQMGRWFGYRPGYEDLPRVWMTETMESYFRDMATLEAEIRRDIAVYEEDETANPLNFAVRIRQHPELAITSRKKMAGTLVVDISFGRRYLQTIHFRGNDKAWLDANWEAGSALVDHVDDWDPAGSNRIARNVGAVDVLSFLDRYELHERSRFRKEDLMAYIRKQIQFDDSLRSWTVGIVGKAAGHPPERPLGNLVGIHTVDRSRIPDTIPTDTDIRVLMSRSDALIDLDKKDPGNWPQILEFRRNENPILLLYPINKDSRSTSKHRVDLEAAADVLGMGIVFPGAAMGTAHSYVHANLPDFDEEEEITYKKDEVEEPS